MLLLLLLAVAAVAVVVADDDADDELVVVVAAMAVVVVVVVLVVGVGVPVVVRPPRPLAPPFRSLLCTWCAITKNRFVSQTRTKASVAKQWLVKNAC